MSRRDVTLEKQSGEKVGQKHSGGSKHNNVTMSSAFYGYSALGGQHIPCKFGETRGRSSSYAAALALMQGVSNYLLHLTYTYITLLCL